MNKIFYLIFLLVVPSLKTIARDEAYPDSLMDGSLFQIDDSLLFLEYPEAFIKIPHVVIPGGSFSHVNQIHYTPNNNGIKDYLIIVSQSLYDSLNTEIKTYAEDVHAIYGYGIYIETVENPTPNQLKSLIMNYQSNLCGVLFVGDLGEAMYEIQNDYNQYGYKKWPCDLFFMDLDGVWTDSDGNGIFDNHAGNVAPEIFVARLSASGLSTYGDEASLIRTQLQKSHDFWWKESYTLADTVLNYIDLDWNYLFPSTDIANVFASGNVTDVRNGISTVFSASDYLNRIFNDCYGFTHLSAHSSPTLHRIGTGYAYVSNIRQMSSENFAYNLFCCSACNWLAASSQGYLGGAYLFNSGKTLAVVGSTKTGSMLGTHYFYPQLSTQNIGMAYLYWWQHYLGNTHYQINVSWFYGMVILGDPTINFRHHVSDICESSLYLNTFPSENHSNLIMFKAEKSINVGGDFAIPVGVHVIFDAPHVTFSSNFTCPLGASFETRNEGCEL